MLGEAVEAEWMECCEEESQGELWELENGADLQLRNKGEFQKEERQGGGTER